MLRKGVVLDRRIPACLHAPFASFYFPTDISFCISLARGVVQYGRGGCHQSILNLFSHPFAWLCFVHHFVAQCSYIRPADDNFIYCFSFTNFSILALSLHSNSLCNCQPAVNTSSSATPPLGGGALAYFALFNRTLSNSATTIRNTRPFGGCRRVYSRR